MLRKYLDEEDIIEFHENFKECRWWHKKNAFQDINMFTWESLSDIVSTHDFKDLDIVLAKSKKQLDPFELNRKDLTHKVNFSNIFANYIRQGHTLILNSAHRWHPPLSRFCSKLGQELNTYVQTNIYASWNRDDGAFGKHWDEHDALIIQLDGKKYWKMYGKADNNAVSRKHSKGSSDELLSEFVMEKGDILYLPMGQVHSVSMEDDISLHATVGIRRLTGLDVFDWLKEEMAKEPNFRKRLPNIGDKDELNKFMAEFISNLSTIQWNESDDKIGLEKYLKSKITTRPYINFPNIGLPSHCKDFENKIFAINPYITYLGLHKVGLKISDGYKKWVVPREVSKSFKHLLDGQLVSFETILSDGKKNEIEKNTIEKIFSDMLDEGVVTFY